MRKNNLLSKIIVAVLWVIIVYAAFRAGFDAWAWIIAIIITFAAVVTLRNLNENGGKT